MLRQTRRSFIGTSAGLALGLAASVGQQTVGAQESSEASPAASPAVGGWTFVDDRGRTINLPETPKRIFAESIAALSLWTFGIKPAGIVGYLKGYEFPAEWDDVARFDLETGELDIEGVIALDPDISIGFTWDIVTKNDFGAIDESTLPGFTDIAPTLCILAVDVPVNQSIERFNELAAALGADVNSPTVMADRDAFNAASEAVRAAVAAKPGLKAMALSPTVESVYIGNPNSASDLVYFAELGLDMVVPEAPQAYASDLWQQLSWEEIARYPADLFLIDNRPSVITIDKLNEIPVFGLLPAAAAGQYVGWPVEYVTSYAGLTPTLTALAEAITNAEIVSS